MRLALTNPVNATVLDRLATLNLPDSWLVSGSVFQTVWNARTGRDPQHGINDYDVFYFDPDTSWEAEDAIIRQCTDVFADIEAEVQVRNQARVHLWYPQKFGQPYAPLKDSIESLTRFLAPCCSVGLRKSAMGHELAAPFGVDDLLSMTIRRNALTIGTRDRYEEKAARWKACWPEITILPWTED
jgi:hypothetical protein